MSENVKTTKGPRAKPLPLLSLKVAQNNDGQVDSRTLVQWCVSKSLVNMLREEGFVNPQLLLVVRHLVTDRVSGISYRDYHDTAHLVVSLTAEQVFVSFSHVGLNEIVPVIIDVRNGDEAKLVGRLRKGLNEFSNPLTGSVIDDKGDLVYSSGWHDDAQVYQKSKFKSLQTNFTLDVDVPKELFAKEPSARTKAFVGRFFPGKGDDQCATRKRIIGSCLLVGPFILFGTIAKLLLLLGALLFTKREYNLWHLRHPFLGKVAGVIYDTRQDTMLLWQHKNGRRRAWPFIVWNHFGVFVLPLVVFMLMHLTEHHGSSKHTFQISYWGWWKTFLVTNAIYFGVLAIGLIGCGLFLGVAGAWGKIRKSPKATERALKRKELERVAQQTAEQRRAEEVMRQLDAMVCTPESLNRAPSIKDLPKNKLTVRLIFSAAKTAVCRPYAKD